MTKEGALEIFGVPIYAEPYIQTDTFWAFRTIPFGWPKEGGPSRYIEKFTTPEGVFNRELAAMCVISVVKRRGDTPEFCLVHTSKWEELNDDMLKVENYANSIT